MKDPLSRFILKALKGGPLLVEKLEAVRSFDTDLLGDVPKDISIKLDQKIGHIYEDALFELIENSPHIDLVTRNLQIFDNNKQTIGELDFIIYEHETAQHYHLEFAAKFYLAKQVRGEWIYPGPNANDNLNRKLKHMIGHQLKLSQRTQVKEMLRKEFGIEHLEPRQLICGSLFTPLNNSQAPVPDSISKNARIEKWLYTYEWDEFFSNEEDVMIIPKALWVVPISQDMHPYLQTCSVSQLIEKGQEKCAMFTLKGSNKAWFLVPETHGSEI